MKKSIVLYSLLVCSFMFLFSCQSDFYSYKKDYDLWRLPLIEPYELISPTNTDWFITLEKFNPFSFKLNLPYQIPFIDSVGIYKNQIFIHSQYANLPQESRPIWFIINTENQNNPSIVILEEENFKHELQKRNLNDKLTIYAVKELIKNFQRNLRLPKEWPNSNG